MHLNIMIFMSISIIDASTKPNSIDVTDDVDAALHASAVEPVACANAFDSNFFGLRLPVVASLWFMSSPQSGLKPW